MTDFDPHCYTITIKLTQLEEGPHFEAVVAELPDLVEYGETSDQAYALAIDAIQTLREMALEQGRQFPAPMRSQALDEFSGRITLRMSKSLHAIASKLADRDGISLNSWISEAVSTRVGSDSFIEGKATQLSANISSKISNISKVFPASKWTTTGSNFLKYAHPIGMENNLYVVENTTKQISTIDPKGSIRIQ